MHLGNQSRSGWFWRKKVASSHLGGTLWRWGLLVPLVGVGIFVGWKKGTQLSWDGVEHCGLFFFAGAHPPTTYTQKNKQTPSPFKRTQPKLPLPENRPQHKIKRIPSPSPIHFSGCEGKNPTKPLNQPRSLQSRNQKPGLLLAEAELNSTGLVLPHPFGTLNYETTIFRPRGTGVRRLEGEEVPTEASATWDPENHPSTSGCKIWKKRVKGVEVQYWRVGISAILRLV